MAQGMRPRTRPSIASALLLLCACGARPEGGSGFETSGVVVPSTGEPGSSTSSGGEGGEESVGASHASSGGGSSTGPLLDVGSKNDLEPSQPAGCKGKIDFLFVISGQTSMSDIQAQLVDAFPKFIDTIQGKFADFDYHIMVVDGDPFWGQLGCNENCSDKCKAVGYPCAAIDTITACDQTWGGGVVFNAGSLAANKRCDIPDGRRYLIKGDPALKETFACMAQVGESGYDALGAAFAAAMSPEMNGPGGCNEGFLRDDALLFVTFVSVTPDDDSPGTPQDWAAAALAAKHDDPDAIVMFGILFQNTQEWCATSKNNRVCQLIRQFPRWSSIDCFEPDYGPGFEVATDMIEEACADFIPQ